MNGHSPNTRRVEPRVDGERSRPSSHSSVIVCDRQVDHILHFRSPFVKAAGTDDASSCIVWREHSVTSSAVTIMQKQW